jgi:formate dehydrogenase iron-sulfur subunit
MNTKTICYDTHSCIRCYSCMVNCAQENRVRLQRDKGVKIDESANIKMPHLMYITPITRETGKYPNVRRITEFRHCMHCENAPCMKMCPVGAMFRDEKTGAVAVNEAVCIGCGGCLFGCPFDVPVIIPVAFKKKKSYKCIMCYDRVGAGLTTSCVEACPTGAMFMGERDDVLKEAESRAKKYKEVTGLEYIVYGADKLNDKVGKTAWLTIVPQRDQDLYGLKANPVKVADLDLEKEIINYADSRLEKAGTFIGLIREGFKKFAEKREDGLRKG